MKRDDEDVEQVERQIILPPRLSPIKRHSLEEELAVSTVTATQGASTADVPTSTPLTAETQTRDRDLEPKGKNLCFQPINTLDSQEIWKIFVDFCVISSNQKEA